MIGIPRYRSARGRRFRYGRLALVCGVFLAAAWGIGFYRFAQMIPDKPSPDNIRTDAIVVLTGGTGRVQEGLTLLEEGAAKKLFVSGVYRGVDVEALLKLARRSPGHLECCIDLGYAADSTRGNAMETAAWVRKNHVRSIRLVTASYHMPRSLLEFRRWLPPDVRILPNPVFPKQFHQHNWWLWWGSGWLAISEYNKYLFARLSMLLQPRP